VTIGLERPTYSVDEEDGTVEVCAVLLSGSLERTVSVTLSTSDGSAIGMILINNTVRLQTLYL
jgi:hypothetical protein